MDPSIGQFIDFSAGFQFRHFAGKSEQQKVGDKKQHGDDIYGGIAGNGFDPAHAVVGDTSHDDHKQNRP